MKKTIILLLISIITTFILTTITIINNIQIINIENGNITISIFDNNYTYYFEN